MYKYVQQIWARLKNHDKSKRFEFYVFLMKKVNAWNK